MRATCGVHFGLGGWALMAFAKLNCSSERRTSSGAKARDFHSPQAARLKAAPYPKQFMRWRYRGWFLLDALEAINQLLGQVFL